MITAVLTRGSFGGGSRGGSSRGGSYSGSRTSRVTTKVRSWFGGSKSKPKTSTGTTSNGTKRTTVNHTTVVHNHVYAPTRVYGGRTYAFRSGGWGYGYYGPHPYFDSWYGYPVYYGWPGHWSGWTWSWAPIIALLIIGIIAFAIWAVIDWFRR